MSVTDVGPVDVIDPAPYDPAAVASRWRTWASRNGLALAPLAYHRLARRERFMLAVAVTAMLEQWRLDPVLEPGRILYETNRLLAGYVGDPWEDLEPGWRALIAVSAADTVAWVVRSGALTVPATWEA